MRWDFCERLVGLGLVLAGMTVATGCSSGPATGEVHGKVTFKGQPVKEGSVTLIPTAQEGGPSYEAKIGADGSFAVNGDVIAGEYGVEIKPPRIKQDTDPGKSPPVEIEKPAPDIPQKYRMQSTSNLKANVKAGKNDDFVFEMKP